MALSRRCSKDQEAVADVLAFGLLLANGAQVGLTPTFQEFGHDGASGCVRTSL